MPSASFAAISNAAFLPTALPGRVAISAVTIFSSPSRVKAAAFARLATHAVWSKPRRIWSTLYFPSFRYASGVVSFPKRLRYFLQRDGKVRSAALRIVLSNPTRSRPCWPGRMPGFSVDANVRIEGSDRRGLERLLRYCARPPFALERIEMLDEHRLLYHLTKPMHDGRTCVHLTPLELIGCLAALVPAPRSHRHRYYGVLAPNARLRPAVTALIDDTQAPSETGPDGDEQPDGAKRSPARYLWAMLLARIYEAFPLACPVCGSPMTIIAFITDPPVVHHILGAHRRADHTPADLTGS
jgi:hypothetical protein